MASNDRMTVKNEVEEIGVEMIMFQKVQSTFLGGIEANHKKYP
jgi:hypothetical protein